MNNKQIGNNFEREYAEYLSKKGFWVTFLTPKNYVGSQPCDLIAINYLFLVEIKVNGFMKE